MTSKLDIIRCRSFEEIGRKLTPVLEAYGDLFPSNKTDLILLKPNLNSNMNALTGNTTDLRLLSTVIRFLKDQGYTNIIVGEGTNSGFYRNRIGVITRLRIDALAAHYGVQVRDLNYSRPYDIEFNGGVHASVARECQEAKLFINLPKLKTHFEVGMSVCLKNLMGCLIGQQNKKKTHQDLAANILRINQQVRPHLHIVDGLIAMEGLGPTRGKPVRMDTVLIGTDPFLTDLVCARLAGFDYRRVKTLALAADQGLLTEAHHRYVQTLNLAHMCRTFAPPKAGPLATFIHSPKRQKFFLKIRSMRLFEYLAATHWFGHLLFLSGLRQDVFLPEEMQCQSLRVDEQLCDQCGVCRELCPLGRELPDNINGADDGCIQCLYCFLACPRGAIQFEGEFGFMQEQLRQYDERVRRLYGS